MIFLIDYDRSVGRIVSMATFDDSRHREASEARLKLELDYKHAGTEHEIVLLEAASEQALRRTHRRYFESLEELAKVPLEHR